MNQINLRRASVFGLLLIAFYQNGVAQDSTKIKKWFAGYEVMEMTMNNFQNFAGEVGYRIDPKNQMRLAIMEVKLTERHLASKWESIGVDGNNVEGYFRGYLLYYDRFFGKRKNFYFGLNGGYINTQYNYLLGPNRIDNHSPVAGFQIGFQKMNLFNVKHLYVNFSIPFVYYFKSIPEQKWGDTKILEHKLANNVWLFIGYNF